MQERSLKGVKTSRSGPAISHLLFADDCILFGEATIRGANWLKAILSYYKSCSGQQVNFEKSVIFFSKNTLVVNKQLIASLLTVRCSEEPERYLGLPNMVGRRKKESFQNLKDRIKLRIDNCSNKYLSQGGKEVFIKAILQAIPTYTMACFLFPKTLCDDIEGIIAKFWWQKRRGKKGIHWCTRKNLYSLKENKGFGFQNLSQFNIALLAKQGWRLIIYPNSLLAKKSIWVSKGLLQDGLCWKLGNGRDIFIWNDCWILRINTINRQSRTNNEELNPSCRNKLCGLSSLEGKIVWGVLPNSGVYNFPQNLQLQSGVSPGITCLRLQTLGVKGYSRLNASFVVRGMRVALTYSNNVLQVSMQGFEEQSRFFCYALWLIWYSRNQLVHERVSITGRQLAQKILSYKAEQDGTRAKQKILDKARRFRNMKILPKVKVHFDAAFSKGTSKSVSGVVAWGLRDEFLASKTVLHDNVPSPFAVEAYAGLEAIKLGISMGFREIQIKGDSRTVIKKCQSTETDKSAIGAIIRDIQNKSVYFQTIKFQHIPRMKNSRAHKIAKEALASGLTSYLVQVDPNLQNSFPEGRWARRLD
ncbi:hypothetical protein CXB51_025232 [Gossypium anomalum]|uniref:RNase H type-1 domain-containing protein n=1 Tax=Gossypium anomalum TaxID=47600 RepID=A0A8J5YGH6_9ROSI|nr:hypothetical protein CXB51_025232 [Gossypium anomalum]